MKISAATPPVVQATRASVTAATTSAPAAPTAVAGSVKAAPPTYLHPDVAAARLEQGRIAEYTEGTLDPKVVAAGAPAYFRTYEQITTALKDLQTKYPNLVEVIDIGDSSEKVAGKANRDVWAIRLTNKQAKPAAGEKPSVVYIAGEHAREIANPELMMKFIKQTLEGYGTDAEATALLDNRVLNIVPMMNPDGHAVVERGYSKLPDGKLMQRKNTSLPSGVDLNRNYDFRWGGPGASNLPASDIYRGPSAASEPEVQAVQKFITATKPGVFMDWHSYSRLNLYPWGDTKDPTPDHAGLDAMARKFSTWNHYTPQQSIKLYPTSGTSKDWAYGTHKIPGFTIETGDSFHQTDVQFAGSWRENSPIMGYVAKIADAPFQRVKGPDTLDVLLAAGAPGLKRGALKLTAQVSDANNGQDAVKGAEWVTDPSVPLGKGNALTPADGAFDAASELVTGVISQAATGALVYVRAQDAQGNWGPNTAQWLKPANA